jgi:hypothetical protein
MNRAGITTTTTTTTTHITAPITVVDVWEWEATHVHRGWSTAAPSSPFASELYAERSAGS